MSYLVQVFPQKYSINGSIMNIYNGIDDMYLIHITNENLSKKYMNILIDLVKTAYNSICLDVKNINNINNCKYYYLNCYDIICKFIIESSTIDTIEFTLVININKD